MPLIYDEPRWRALYKSPQVDGEIPLTYGPAWHNRDMVRIQPRIENLVSTGRVQNATVGFIGCAWGFELEYAQSLGITDVWGIDPSPYVWANTDGMNLPGRIVNATVGVDSPADIRTLLAAAGMGNPQRFDYIVDSDAISSQVDDAGINAFLDGCEGLLQGNQHVRIIHVVTPLQPSKGPGDSALLWKSMTEWQAYRPGHTWVNALDLTVT